MQDMTPEERLTRMENLLAAIVENQARHDALIDKQGALIDKQNEVIDKHNTAIRDLIVVSRTVLNSIAEMREAQQATDEKLHILIETVDRIIRNRNQ